MSDSETGGNYCSVQAGLPKMEDRLKGNMSSEDLSSPVSKEWELAKYNLH
jgi:hypothetical protein